MSSDGEKSADYKVLAKFANDSSDVVFGARDLQSALKLFAAAHRMDNVKAVSMVALIHNPQQQQPPAEVPQQQQQAAMAPKTQEDPQVAAAVNFIDGALRSTVFKRQLAEPEVIRPFVPQGGDNEDILARGVRPPRRMVDSHGRQRDGDRESTNAPPPPPPPTKRAPTKQDIDQLLQLRGELEGVERANSSSHAREHLAAYIQGVTRTMMDEMDWSEHRSFWPDLETLYARCKAIETQSQHKRVRSE